jgi:hypothetical protein
MNPIKISDVELAFPADISKLLPLYDSIPEEFKDGNRWTQLADDLFAEGGDPGNTKPGIDKREAVRHLQACLGSFQPKHEHKIAGVAWLLSQWFEPKP